LKDGGFIKWHGFNPVMALPLPCFPQHPPKHFMKITCLDWPVRSKVAKDNDGNNFQSTTRKPAPLFSPPAASGTVN
jgi:hypothetical protein